MAFSKPQVVDLAATVSQVRGRAIRRENVNGYQEVRYYILFPASAVIDLLFARFS